jgi:hypothetical protein
VNAGAATDPSPLPELPAAVRVRFSGYDEAALCQPGYRPFVIGRLLEEGTGEELRWLLATVGKPALAAFVRAHGGRALSRRSRAFWQRVLAVEAAAPPPLVSELWPLA